MKNYLLVIILLLTISAKSSNEIKISLLTCSEGDALYSAFGHTALKVYDRSTHSNLVYNFGQFDFNTPNFYLKFLKGQLHYRLGIHNYYEFVAKYSADNRAIVEQELNLPREIKQQLADTLRILYKPQHRYYLYHFMDKNCTSKIRDLIFHFLNLQSSFVSQKTDRTFRQMLNYYLEDKPALQVGIDLITGSEFDSELNKFQTTALPYTLMNAIDTLQYKGKPLVKEKMNVVSYERESSPWSQIIVFGMIALFTIIWLSTHSIILSKFIWILTALPGILIFWLPFISMHSEVLNNWNLLWVHPFYLLLLSARLRSNKMAVRTLVAVFLIAIVIRILVALTGIQALNPVFVFWMLLLVLTLAAFPSIRQLRIVSIKRVKPD